MLSQIGEPQSMFIGPATALRRRGRSSVSGTQSHINVLRDTRSPGRRASKKPVAAAVTSGAREDKLPLRSSTIASVIG